MSSLSPSRQPYSANYGQSGIEEFMFTTKMLDELSGLYYFAARFYNDSTGRFMTEDSNTGTQDDPMTLNRYIYARDNPMEFTDPTGNRYIVNTGQGMEQVEITKTSSGTTISTTSDTSTTTTHISPTGATSTTTVSRAGATPTPTVSGTGSGTTSASSTQTSPSRSADVVLAESGNNQYVTTTSGSTSATTTTTSITSITTGNTNPGLCLVPAGSVLWFGGAGPPGDILDLIVTEYSVFASIYNLPNPFGAVDYLIPCPTGNVSPEPF